MLLIYANFNKILNGGQTVTCHPFPVFDHRQWRHLELVHQLLQQVPVHNLNGPLLVHRHETAIVFCEPLTSLGGAGIRATSYPTGAPVQCTSILA